MQHPRTLTIALACVAGIFARTLPIFASADADDEIDRYLASMRAKMEDRARPIDERERFALEMAGTLDRAAQAASSVEARRARWAEAAGLLDTFSTTNPGHPRSREFALQAAIYHWARAQSWVQEVELKPSDAEATATGVLELNEVVKRLSRLRDRDSEPSALTDRVRSRLALALRDRAGLEPEGSTKRRKSLEMALAELSELSAEARAQGFVELLRADVLNALDRFEEALAACEQAGQAKPPPEPAEHGLVKLRSLIGLRRFADARQWLGSAKLDQSAALRAELALNLAARNAEPPGPARDEAESHAVHAWQQLRKAGPIEARRATLMLSRGLEQPGPPSTPDVWNAVAEGRLLRGDADGAIRVLRDGAARAESAGNEQAAAEMRYAAAAALYQSKRFAQAEAALKDIVDDPHAGDVRPKASLLRALTLTRHHAASGARTDDRTAFISALDAHVRQFPEDPTSAEALWLLGQARAERGDREGAIAAWETVPRKSTRWLDSRLAIAAEQRSAVESSLAYGDRTTAAKELAAGRAMLDQAVADATDLAVRDEIELARARLELIPVVGEPERARALMERLVARPLRVESRHRLTLYRILPTLRAGRFSDALRDATSLAKTSRPTLLLDLARLLDLSAATSESNLVERRTGQVLKEIIRAVLQSPTSLSSSDRKLALLEMARAISFTGDAAAARSYLERMDIQAGSMPAGLLPLLGDTQVRLDAYAAAIKTYRSLTSKSAPGSRTWLEARYGMALAYERSGELDSSKRIIDATAVLHPDLGGGDLQAKYEKLRVRLAR